MNRDLLNIQTASGYFDSNDYEEPVKTYVNQDQFIQLSSSWPQTYEIAIQENEALLSDNLFFSTGYKSKKFYSISPPVYRSYSNQLIPNLLTQIRISLSREGEQYERVVYTFFDMFGYLGGLFDFLYFAGYLFVGYFNNKKYMLKILSKLYQVEKSHESPDLINEKTLDNSIHLKSKLSKDRDLHDRKYQDFSKSFDHFRSNFDPQTSVRQDDMLNFLNRSLMHRRMYSYK